MNTSAKALRKPQKSSPVTMQAHRAAPAAEDYYSKRLRPLGSGRSTMKISVCIPTFNSEAYLSACLESVLPRKAPSSK